MDQERAQAAVKLGVQLCRAIVETVKEAGPAPESIIFAAMQQRGVSFASCTTLVDVCINTGALKRVNNCLVYIEKGT